MERDAASGAGHAVVAVEILCAPGCPHLVQVRERLTTVAGEEGVAIDATETLIATPDQARQRRFPG